MSTGRVRGKVVVVTGAGSGIGRATALMFAREGASRVYLVGRDEARLNDVAAEIASAGVYAKAMRADLAVPTTCQGVIDRVVNDATRIDVLISNAGTARQIDLLDVTQEIWDGELAVNLSMHFFMCQAAARAMVAKGNGGVLLCTSSCAGYGGLPRQAPYAAAKAGLVNLVQTMALELAKYRIRVNCVSPGPTDTPLAESQVGKEAFDEARKAFPTPLGRIAQPEEIASGFLYLASDEASFVTALDLSIDSGVTRYAVSFGQIST